MMWYYRRGEAQMGPVSWEDLVNTARAGGLGSGDLVWTDGMAQWQAAATIPGLLPGPLPGQLPVQAPVAMPAARPVYAGPPRPSAGDDPMMRMLLPVGRSGWAIAAGYLGLLSVLGIFAPISLVVGIVAVRDIQKHPEKHGLGRAWFGIVMGVLGSIALVVLHASLLASNLIPK
ncbi:MAG TPA: GYF domain-containing protein [Thermoanaerobaculia bacterium]|nr:GYF domain-containing protein [Thermoanaerobaculia bacterium]